MNRSAIVDPLTTFGTWEGFGTSLCWFAQAFGQRDDVADALFSLQLRVTIGDSSASVPGLGLTIARYNAGASSNVSAGGASMQRSPNVSPTRLLDAFWLTWEGGGLGRWDWSRDANQRAMLLKAKVRGAKRFQLFSNSPVWWMCTNHNPSGADNGARDNLQSWNHQQHANYLAEIAAHYTTTVGVAFESVEPLNEPIATWWKSTGTQEGCHFDVETQSAAVTNLRKELDRRNLSHVLVAASDENSYTEAISTWAGIGPEARQAIGRVQVHGYEYGGGRRDLLYQSVHGAGKPIWNSEYGDGDGSGLSLASNLNLDFQWLHPTAWVYWQALDGGGWGLVNASNEHTTISGPNPKFFVLAQYTRHVRPGMTIIQSGDPDTVAAYSAHDKKLVLVAVNTNTSAQQISFDLSKFARVGGPTTLWRTIASGTGDKYARHDGPSVGKGGHVLLSIGASAVVTVEVENVVV
jgi:galactan endo-1,6-beta-galactosidase